MLGRPKRERRRRRVVDDEKVVAVAVEAVGISPCVPCAEIGDSRHLLVEDAVAERLRAPHLGGGGGEPHFQVAEPPERWSASRDNAPSRKPAREERRQCGELANRSARHSSSHSR